MHMTIPAVFYARCRLSFAAAALGSTLPSSGPTGHQIVAEQRDTAGALLFQLVEVTDAATLPRTAGELAPPLLMTNRVEQPSDLIGPGDILEIVIYEAGITVFSGTGARVATEGFDPSAKAERLPALRVDDNGNINLPYVGMVNVAGRTPRELQDIIVSGLLGKSQSPQALVTVQQSITNSVIIGGEVARAGRLPLATNRETLQDIIAIAGGYRGDAADLVVRIERQNQRWSTRLSGLLRSPLASMPIVPGDRILLLREPQSYSVLGSPNQSSQIPFGKETIFLAEALARAGGANPNLGDPAAIFVFRYVTDAQGVETPVVYHLNMMKAGSFFLAQRFRMQNEDVLYVANARANQPTKLVQILSQLFTPFVIARDITR